MGNKHRAEDDGNSDGERGRKKTEVGYKKKYT